MSKTDLEGDMGNMQGSFLLYNLTSQSEFEVSVNPVFLHSHVFKTKS